MDRVSPDYPGDAIDRLYDIDAASAQLIGGGDEAETWRIQDASRGSWCVKWFRRQRPQDLQSRVELMDRLADDGFPIPRVHPTRAGELVGSLHGRGVTVTEWIDGSPVDALAVETGDAAGRMLARLHVALRRHGQPARPSSKNWEVDRPEQAIATCESLRARIEALHTASDLDRRIHDALGERILALSKISGVRQAMPPLSRQRLHGDYTRPNLLFAEGSLVAVLDLLGPVGHPAWELGRLAFEPLTVARRADWPQAAQATFAGYRAEATLPEAELAAAVRTTLLYNLFSFWGISQRYPPGGAVIATGNEDYWLARHLVARLLLADLTGLDALVRR
jgi:Ser/Thr protein kinase RdoA (MazF antagonist)